MTHPTTPLLLVALLFVRDLPADPSGWTFTTFTNTTAKTIDVTADVRRLSPRLDGTTLRLMPHLGGFIQIGGYSATGELRISEPDPHAERLVVRAARHANRDYGRHMPVFVRAPDGARRDLAVLTLSDEPAEFTVAIPALRHDDTIVLSSTTNHLAAANPRCAVNLHAVALVAPRTERRPGGLVIRLR